MSDIERLGFGVLIGMLGGNHEAAATIRSVIGKTIAEAWIDDDANGGNGALNLRFSDGTGVMIYDAGQCCCEVRYIKTDDDLSYHIGATLIAVEVKEGPEVKRGYGIHEMAFLHVKTSKGEIVVNTHNEHNGYYGGFWFEARLLDNKSESVGE